MGCRAWHTLHPQVKVVGEGSAGDVLKRICETQRKRFLTGSCSCRWKLRLLPTALYLSC